MHSSGASSGSGSGSVLPILMKMVCFAAIDHACRVPCGCGRDWLPPWGEHTILASMWSQILMLLCSSCCGPLARHVRIHLLCVPSVRARLNMVDCFLLSNSAPLISMFWGDCHAGGRGEGGGQLRGLRTSTSEFAHAILFSRLFCFVYLPHVPPSFVPRVKARGDESLPVIGSACLMGLLDSLPCSCGLVLDCCCVARLFLIFFSFASQPAAAALLLHETRSSARLRVPGGLGRARVGQERRVAVEAVLRRAQVRVSVALIQTAPRVLRTAKLQLRVRRQSREERTGLLPWKVTFKSTKEAREVAKTAPPDGEREEPEAWLLVNRADVMVSVPLRA